MWPVVDILSDHLEGLRIEVADSGTYTHYVENDLVDFQHGKDMRTTQFVGLPLGLLELERIQHCLGHVVFFDRLLLGGGVIIDDDELVPEEVQLSTHDGGEVIVEAENGARPHDGSVGEGLAYNLFTLRLGLEVQRGRVVICAGSREVDEAMHSMFRAGLGDAFSHLDIDELKILFLLEFVARAEQVDDYV